MLATLSAPARATFLRRPVRVSAAAAHAHAIHTGTSAARPLARANRAAHCQFASVLDLALDRMIDHATRDLTINQ